MQVLNAETIDKQREKLLAKMRTLSEWYGCFHKARSTTVSLVRIMSSYTCERQIKHLLENYDLAKENQRFDSYYREKSVFATAKIVESLKTRLDSEGANAAILTEAPSKLGRYDVVVIQGYPCEVYAKGEEIVRIEVKASLGLKLEQIDRYLWDSSPLILARVITGHVAKLQPLALKSYITFSLKELNAKADRLLSGKLYTVLGRGCFVCLNDDCPFNRRKNKKSISVMTMSDDEFAEDLNSFFQNLSYVAEKTANLVIEELPGLAAR